MSWQGVCVKTTTRVPASKTRWLDNRVEHR
jgi:hypothetical protein